MKHDPKVGRDWEWKREREWQKLQQKLIFESGWVGLIDDEASLWQFSSESMINVEDAVAFASMDSLQQSSSCVISI